MSQGNSKRFNSFRFNSVSTALACALPVSLSLLIQSASSYASGPATEGLVVAYDFSESSGSVVHDISGVGDPIDLSIQSPSNVSWSECSALEIHTPTLISQSVASTKLIEQIKASNAITVEAWVTPKDNNQTGPARIATLSDGALARNFTLGQNQGSMQFRLRTTDTGVNGTNAYLESGGTTNLDLVRPNHIVYTRSDADQLAKFYINGELISSTTISGSFSNWDSNMSFGLGNEFGSERPWLGKFYSVSVYDKALSPQEVQQNAAVDVLAGCNQKPQADFSMDQMIGELGFEISFDGSISKDNENSIVSYEWDFGDGHLASGALQTHIYEQPGSFHPTLTVTDDQGQTSIHTRYVKVLSPGAYGRSAIEPDLLYVFGEAQGSTIHNMIPSPENIDLTIEDMADVQWKTCGGLNVTSATQINSSSSPSAFISEIKNSNAATIEAWIVPNNIEQSGPSSIMTLGSGTNHRNFLLGQETNEFVTRFRTTGTDNGATDLFTQTAGQQARVGLSHVVYTRGSDGIAKIYVDGVLAGSEVIPSSASNWRDDTLIGVSNGLGGSSPWLGEIYLLAAYSEALHETEIVKNYNAGVLSDCNIDPVARFETSTDAGVIPLSILFDASSSQDYDGTILSYTWDFGDGSTASGEQVNHTFNDSGNYTVTLTVEDDQGAVHATTKQILSIPTGQVTLDRIAHYDFSVAAGSTIFDRSGFGTPLNLHIPDSSAAHWLSCGGLSIENNTYISQASSSEKIKTAIESTQEFAIEAWIKPDSLSQNGPARIVSYSNGPYARNFTLGQSNENLAMRFRTSGTNDNGTFPHLQTNNNGLTLNLTHVVYTRDSEGQAKLYVDGNVVETEQITGLINNWGDDYTFGLGAETTGDRNWMGDLHQVSLYQRALVPQEVEHNFSLGVLSACGNQAPIITSSPLFLIAEGDNYTYQVIATDPDGDAITYSISSSIVGMTIDAQSGLVQWQSDADSEGEYPVQITATDSSGLSFTQSFTLIVTNSNRAPVASDLSLDLTEDSSIAVVLNGSDADQDDTLSFAILSTPQHGALSGTAPNLVYTPNANYFGQDLLQFLVNDGSINSNPATVSFTVAAVNDAPTASEQELSVLEDSTVAVVLSATDIEADPLTFAIQTQPINGQLTGTPPALTYTPFANFSGTDSFTFSANDGEYDSNTVSISLEVLAVNDSPTITSTPVTTVDMGQLWSYLFAANDPDGDSLTYTLNVGAQGMVIDPVTGFIEWQTAIGNEGDYPIEVTAQDAGGLSVTQSFTLSVINTNQAPVSSDIQISLAEDSQTSITLSGSDADLNSLTYSIISQPQNGLLSGTAPNLIYTPTGDFFGSDSFEYLVNDGLIDSNIATVALTVSSVNDAPVATAISVNGVEDTLLGLALTATDVDGDELSYTIQSQPSNGQLTGTPPALNYVPNENFEGSDSFTFSANDGEYDSNTVSVSIDVASVNDAPSITSLPELVVGSGQTWSYVLTASDPDANESLTFEIVSAPAGATFDQNDPSLMTWTALDVAPGNYDFEVRVTDSTGDSDSQLFAVTVLPDSSPATHVGKEFFVPLAVPENPSSATFYLFFRAAESSAQVELTHLATGRSETILVPADEIVPYLIPAEEIDQVGGFEFQTVLESHAVHIESDVEISVYGLNQQEQSTDGYLAYPVSALGKEYIAAGYHVFPNTADKPENASMIIVVATEDNTNVEINGAMDLFLDDSTVIQKGDIHTILMNKGDVYQLQGRGSKVADLSGSMVSADRPIAVFGAHECANVPRERLHCDHLIEQMPPIKDLGTEYFSVPLHDRPEDLFRVLAPHDNTQIFVNDVLRADIDKQGVFEWVSGESQRVTATKPIVLMQYAIGAGFGGLLLGDPFMLVVPAAEQYLSSYTINTPTTNIENHYVNIIVPTSDITEFTVDGNPVDSTSFTPLSDSAYSYVTLPIEEGTHRLTSPNPFGAYVFGFDDFDSYGYAAGMAFGKPEAAAQLDVADLAPMPFGTEACLSAVVLDSASEPLAGVQVQFSRSSPSNLMSYDLTDAQGVAQFCYRGREIGVDNWIISINDISSQVDQEWLAASTDAAPIILSLPRLSLIPNERDYSYQVEAIDPLGGELSYSLISITPGGHTQRLSNAGLLEWGNTGTSNSYSNGTTAIQVTNSAGLSSVQEFQFYQPLYNQAPVFSVLEPNTQAVEGVPYIYNNQFVNTSQVQQMFDLDVRDDAGIGLGQGDSFVVSFVEGPENAYIEQRNSVGAEKPIYCLSCDHLIRWVPAEPGTQEVVLSARDAQGLVSDEQRFTVDVSPNLPPTVSVANPTEVIAVHELYRIYLEIENDVPLTQHTNLDNLQVVLEEGPSRMEVRLTQVNSTQYYHLYFRPLAADIGRHNVRLYVTDSMNQSNTIEFEVEVVEGSQRPYITSPSSSSLTAEVGARFEQQFEASDLDGSPVVYHIINAPEGVVISESGLLTWLPTEAQEGLIYSFTVIASDDTGRQSLSAFSITAIPFDNDDPGNDASLSLVNQPKVEAFAGTFYSYGTAAIANHGGAVFLSLLEGPAGMTLRENPLIPGTYLIEWTPDEANCQHDVRLGLQDNLGNTQQVTFTIDVYNAPKRLNRFQCSIDAEFCAVR